MLIATNPQQTNQNSPKTTRANTPIKMERRESSSSYSSLEDLEQERKKFKAVTSTPLVISEPTNSINVNIKSKLNQRTDIADQQQNFHQRKQESDDYDEDESADEKYTQPREHCKRRLSGRSLTDKATSYEVDYNANNPNSLRKKFRSNRFVLNNGDESGFVDSSNNSQLRSAIESSTVTATKESNLNNNSKSNSSSDSSSPPQSNGNSSPESGIGEREDMKYMCPICDAVSQTAHQFTNHIRSHNYASGHTENFTCRICSKVLSSASSLDRHVLVHTGERPFNCKYCHLTFTTNGNMHRHMRTHKQHQHTHHRRNSNGTKFNSSNNNNNCNSTNNNNTTITATTTATTTTAGANKTTPSNGQLNESIKLSTTIDTTMTTMTTVTTATAVTVTSSPTKPELSLVTTAAATATATTNAIVNAAYNNYIYKSIGGNGEHLNGNAKLESCESDGGCSSDSSTVHTYNNNNNNDKQNNNNDFQISNTNYKWKRSSDQPHEDHAESKEDGNDLLKQHLILDNSSDHSASYKNNTLLPNRTSSSFACHICNERDFADNLSLDQHIESKHIKISTKCKHCGVIYLNQYQYKMHICVANIKDSMNLSVKQHYFGECSKHHTEEDRDELEDNVRDKHELFQHFKNVVAQSNSPLSHINQDLTEDDIKSEPSAHDSKDLADIQSILNLTASSSNSNLLKNFEQSVNTPSSQYSYDRDEEEAQDEFTSEFRKMKLRGEFPCKLCRAVYPNLRALKGHNRVHLSEAGPTGPFRCNMCPYSICDKAALIRHMRTHNGDRPYECAVCNYAFTTKANCERHLRNRHGKTTREDVKRAIIYHPSEDSSCDDTAKKLHMFSSTLDEDYDSISYHQHQPKDRSTPVSHLKERLTLGDSPSLQPVKIQVKNLEDLLDKSAASSGYHDSYDRRNIETSQGPIDMSMDVLDLSKKPSASQQVVNEEKMKSSTPIQSLSKPNIAPTNEIIKSQIIPLETESKLDKQHQQMLLAQQQLLSDPNQLMQQLYRNLLFPQLSPFFMHNNFMNNNFTDFQKLAPILTHMMGGVAAAATMPSNDIEKPSKMASVNTNTLSSIPQINPLIPEKPNSATLEAMTSTKILVSPDSNNLPIARHVMPSSAPSNSSNLLPTMLSNGPVKMVLKNGVFMPKQKQRRYRTERPFACEHCSARFTLRSNMERHVKQQHPQFYAQRQRSGHHIMRGRAAAGTPNINNIAHFQAVAQGHYNPGPPPNSSHSPISDQVKCAILAQQLKTRKDTDLLQQALAHGSNSVANSNMFSQHPSNLINGQTNFYAFNPNHNPHLSQNGISNGSMEDDEPKLIIDEDDDEDEEDDDEIEEIPDDHEEDEDKELVLNECNDKIKTYHLPETTKEVKTKPDKPQESAKKVAESILEQAIKAKQDIKPVVNSLEPALVASSNNTMKSMIAQAPAVGKFLKDVASSSFKDESQDLVSVSELVDNATNNSVSFNSYFRPSDVANQMEPSDEDGLVASSASESNNSGAEDTVSTEKPKKKSAYSLAPNRVHCPYCQRMFPWSSSLRRHILTHTGQKPFKCSHCPLLFTTKSNCDRHLLRKHGDVESAVSVYVPTEDVSEPIPLPKSVEEIERMQRMREEEERKRKAEEQRVRLEKEHLEKQKFEQEQQQKQAFLKQLAVAQFQQFTQKPDVNAVPSSELPFKCHLCESSFSERLQCLDHIKALHPQEFASLLSKGAIENETDSSHMTSTEEDERQRFAEDTAKGGKYPDYSNRKVICAFCMRRFWSTEDLRRHMRTHSGERPFQCEICLRKFTLKHSMLRHMKKHNGLHTNGNQSNSDNLANGNSGSDYSDDEQTTNSLTTPPLSIPTTSINALLMGPKFQELLHKANEWRNGNLNTLRDGKENHSEETNTPQTSDLIGNLLGISDQGIINKLMSSPDEAAKFLGVDK